MKGKIDVKVRIWLGEEIAFGPGKADLLEAIAQNGSISAAARAMNMSYRRAWLLVDAMNRSFSDPLISTVAGGQKGGGASVTPNGAAVLARYRNMQRCAQAALEADRIAIEDLLAFPPGKD
ncbi:MAG: winged helix-turn-helix domain-containing protein [Pseudomonadota bacterium]